EGVLIIAILGLIFEAPYNPISLIAHILLLVGYATKNHRFYYFYVVLAIISCVFLVLAVISCIVSLVQLSRKKYPDYAWKEYGYNDSADIGKGMFRTIKRRLSREG
ncbi:hypothetical protein AAVH_12075, partial [Aphelenchoides avenae]